MRKTPKRNSKKKLIIGLTGSMGSGKSELLDVFRSLGAFTVSADAVAAELLTNKKCYSKILKVFREALNKDGSFNKYKISEVVFRNRSKRKKLESLLHPLITKEIISLIKKTPQKIAVIEAPLLFEAGFNRYTDLNVCVLAKVGDRKRRLSFRGWSTENIRGREKSQYTQEKKAELSDVLLRNYGNLKELRKEASVLYRVFERLAA